MRFYNSGTKKNHVSESFSRILVNRSGRHATDKWGNFICSSQMLADGTLTLLFSENKRSIFYLMVTKNISSHM